jgi:NAD(P)-dependent dehydrogenase (short-subunit alcohol dehydrogenase family)
MASPVEVVASNARLGPLNAVEEISTGLVHEVFETSTLGTDAKIRGALPQFRKQWSGVVTDVLSGMTLRPIHLLSVAIVSTVAANAFNEALAPALKPFGVRAGPGGAWSSTKGFLWHQCAQPHRQRHSRSLWRLGGAGVCPMAATEE